jgi:hypothetical protein
MCEKHSLDLDLKDSEFTRPRLIDVGKHVLYFKPNAQHGYSQPEPCVGILNIE